MGYLAFFVYKFKFVGKMGQMTDYLTTQPEFLACFQEAKNIAQFWLRDKPHDVMPHLLVWTKPFPGPDEKVTDGPMALSVIAMNVDFNGEMKYATLQQMGHMFRQERKVPMVIAFFSEAWHSFQKVDKENIIPAGEAPDRREIIGVAARNMDYSLTATSSTPLLRETDGRIFPLFSWEDSLDLTETNLLDCFYLGFFGKHLKPRPKQ